jgi:hypothetical protein
LDPDLLEMLTRQAREIVDVLENGCSQGAPHGRLDLVSRQQNGKVRIEFTAPRGPVYLIEASADLLHWERIGVAAGLGSAQFQFEDIDASRHSARFYRIVTARQ